jgi:hypothetical protein
MAEGAISIISENYWAIFPFKCAYSIKKQSLEDILQIGHELEPYPFFKQSLPFNPSTKSVFLFI